MDIITADKAREITNKYIPYRIEPAVNCVMKEIADSAKHGDNVAVFTDILTPSLYWSAIATKEFESFIKKYGYGYEYRREEESCYSSSQKIIISW